MAHEHAFAATRSRELIREELAALTARVDRLENANGVPNDPEFRFWQLASEVKALIKIMPMGNNDVEAARARLYRLVYPDAEPKCCGGSVAMTTEPAMF